jgi:membrane peptidoglycan carboxypeptidase
VFGLTHRGKQAFLGSLVVVVTLGGSALLGYGCYRRQCPSPCIDLGPLLRFEPYQASVVYERNGTEIGRFFVQDRRLMSLSEIPLHARQAFLAIEDAHFYSHRGVDPRRLLGAVFANLQGGRQGASTITMQLARNVYPELLPPEQRTVKRKLREIRVAQLIEQALPKDTILQHYLNTIYLGHGAYGVSAASRVYFGKPIAAVSIGEAALLASLPRAPSVINPYLNPVASRERRELVLSRMHDLGWLSDSLWHSALAEEVRLAPSVRDSLGVSARVGAHFLETVRQQLQHEFGPALYRGGFQVYTTLDATAQRTAEQVLETELRRLEDRPDSTGPKPSRRSAGPQLGPSTSYLQAGFVVLDPDSGDVRVLIGSRSFKESSFNRITQAWRQPGSAFKTFVYAAALRGPWHPTDSISDEPIAVSTPGRPPWRPENYNRGERNGKVSLETALAKSLNRATVRLGLQVGMRQVIETAHTMGMADPLPGLPSTLLGAADVRPIELVAGYIPLARADGQQVRPRYVLRVESSRGARLLGNAPVIAPGLEPHVARAMRQMLEQVIQGGTGRSVRTAGYQGPVAGKTGTTNGTTNAWFVGVTPELVAGLWIGFDRPRAILPDGSATGGRIAAPIWAAIMKKLPRKREVWVESPPAEP